MTDTEKAAIIAKLDELRAAIPFCGGRPKDILPFRLLHEVKEMVGQVERNAGATLTG